VIILDQIKIRNLRSLKDTGYIDIKPLTVLVGKNSSGKSTFLRFFPLMKQTLSTKKNEPILWYSKENVDFGSFRESINKKNTEKNIGFDFNFNIYSNKYRSRILRSSIDDIIPISLSIDLLEKSLDKINIKIFDSQIILKEYNNEYSLNINNQEIKDLFKVNNPNVFENLLPRLFLMNKDTEIGIEKLRKTSINIYFKELIYDFLIEKKKVKEDHKEIKSKIKNDIEIFMQEFNFLTLKKVAEKDISILDYIKEALNDHESEEDFLKDYHFEQNYIIDSSEENTLLEFLKKATSDEYEFINNLFLGTYVNKLIESINEYFISYFSQVHYIAPLRASAQRYYRLQGLSVDEIDPQGENIPMAINHLSKFEKRQFKTWMKINFGFQIDTTVNGGHVTLNISFDDEENLNLADTGFGFSQILPILLLLWRTRDIKDNFKSTRSMMAMNTHNIVIEQPELHLHPALQSRLTDALITCIKEANSNNIRLNIIIETHSETIINRIGYLVYKEKIDQDKVNVLIFGDLEKQNHSDSCINSVSFDEEGRIKDWPLGFFYPEV